MFASMLMMFGMTAMAEDVIWSEDWSGVTEFKVDPSTFNPNYTFTGTVLNEDGSFKSGTTFYNENLAGGEVPELLIAKNGGSFSATIALNGKSGEMILTFKANKALTVTAEGAELGEVTNTGTAYTYPVTVAEGTDEITITFTQSQSNNARFDDAKLYQGTAKKPAGLSWGKSSTTLTIGEEVTLVISNENNLPVEYTSSNEEAATIDAEGVITLVAAGKTTLTAAFAGNDEYEAQSVSIEVTVKEGAQPVDEVISVAKALEIIAALEDGATTAEEYEVKGFIVGDPDFQRRADGTLYGNVNFTMADEKNGTALLTVYRAKNVDNVNFTEETITLKDGDEVTLKGKLKKYLKDGETTPELVNGYLVSNVTVGINETKTTAAESVVYNLAGQRVAQPTKGLYIINGKKVIK